MLCASMSATVPPILYAVDFSDCDALAGRTPEEIAEKFGSALLRAGATIVRRASHNFPGKGLTAVLILSESHAVLHSWPEAGSVNIDIFSCSTKLRSLQAIDELKQYFRARQVSIQEIARAGERFSPVVTGIDT